MTANSISMGKENRSNLWKEIITAIELSAGAAVALGFSRFAYALLLPAMRADLGWTYVEAGALNTANGAGYIVGALVATWIAKRWGTCAFLASFSASVLVLLITGATTSFSVLFALRAVGGVSTALTFILGAALAAAICPTQNPRRRGTLVGLYIAGASIGIVMAGGVIPIILQGGVQYWPQGWVALGVIGAAALPVVWRAVRGLPDPIGGEFATLKIHEFRRLAPTFIGYTLFGAGYVGYMTFIMALLQKQGSSSRQMILFWLFLGIVSAISTLLWGRALGAFHNGRGPASVFAMTMLGAVPVLLFPGPTAMFASALLFGGSFLAGPTSITIVAQRELPASSWTAAISLLTVGFALGQAVGPILAGAVSDGLGNIAAGFWVSPILLGSGACVNLLQRE